MSEDKLDKILGVVVHMKDKMDNEMVTKQEIVNLEDKILIHIDGFIKLHETLDTEVAALRSKYDRLEGRIKTVETKLGIEAK
jgi:hypothetical protein